MTVYKLQKHVRLVSRPHRLGRPSPGCLYCIAARPVLAQSVCGLTAPREVLTGITPSAISDGSLPHGGAAMLSQRVSLTKLETLRSSKLFVPEPF